MLEIRGACVMPVIEKLTLKRFLNKTAEVMQFLLWISDYIFVTHNLHAPILYILLVHTHAT